MKIYPGGALRGILEMPGDKSISHRAAILAAITDGRTRISNFAPGADCRSTLRCLRGLGVKIDVAGSLVAIEGGSLNGLVEPGGPLDCGNSGTTMRLLAGIAAGQPFTTSLIGDASLAARPMGRVIEPLLEMGAGIVSDDEKLPLTIAGQRPLRPIDYVASNPSAQVKSCILLAGIFANGVTTVRETVATRDHTELMLRHFGVPINRNACGIGLTGGSRLTAGDIEIPGDVSSAAFFLTAAACLPGSELLMRSVGINDSRSAILGVLTKCGVSVELTEQRSLGAEAAADIRVQFAEFNNDHIVVDGPLAALLIDEAPILAVLGTQLPNGLSFRDASDLRNKESDRIRAICRNLELMGAEVEEFADGFRTGSSRLVGTAVSSFGDHRISMAMAVAALLADGPTEIEDAKCVDISYPGFFETLNSVVM